MATSFTDILKLALPATGELAGTWGDVVNQNITSMVEEAIAGSATVDTWAGASATLTVSNGTTSQSRAAILELSGAPGAAATVICPDATKIYIVRNLVSGGFAATIKTASGTGVTIPNGKVAAVFCDGTNVQAATDFFSTVDIDGGTIDGTAIGATTPSTGAFTTLASNSTTTLNGTTIPASATLTKTTDKLSVFAATTSAELAGVISDETGTGALVFAGSPALTGNPTAPNQAAGSNNTRIANTAHVFAERTNTATLTNKTLTSPTITGTGTAAFGNLSYTGTLTGSTGVMNIGSGQLVKDASGNVLVGSDIFVTGAFSTASRLQLNGQTGSTSSFQATTWMPAATTAGQLVLQKSRGAAIGTRGVVLNNDFLGRIFFGGDDGTNFIPGASIDALVDGTPGTNAMPGRISFSTTPSGSNNPSERMRITSTGNVGIGTTSPGSALQVQGLITGTAVTQSQTDTTANRLLKYGDFGLGSTTLPIITEAQLESSYPTGFARVASTTDNERPFNFGSILSLSYDSPANRQTQLAIGNSDRRLAFRGTQAGRDWNYVYHTNNILSTVSQSGGVPTGGIIEQGSNANGEFVKYADGTVVARFRVTKDLDRSVEENLFWTLPVAAVNNSTGTVSFSPAVGIVALLRTFYNAQVGAQFVDGATPNVTVRTANNGFSGSIVIQLIAVYNWF